MAGKDNNTLIWIIGIVLFVLLASNLGVIPKFAIVTKTICVENKISYYDFNTGSVAGKFGNAMQFNGNNSINIPLDANANATTMWVKNYSRGDTSFYFLAKIKGINYVNSVQSDTRQILPLGPTFGLGFNGSVDDLATFSDLSVRTMQGIYASGAGKEVCYTQTYEENVTCKDYATQKVGNPGNGCLNYTGTYFPSCTYEWETQIQYKVVNNHCDQQYYCSPEGLTLAQCQVKLTPSTSGSISGNTSAPIVTTAADAPTKGEGLNKEMFQIAGKPVTLLHLIVLFILVGVLIYFNKKK